MNVNFFFQYSCEIPRSHFLLYTLIATISSRPIHRQQGSTRYLGRFCYKLDKEGTVVEKHEGSHQKTKQVQGLITTIIG